MTPVNIFHDLKTHHTVIFEKTTEGAYICPIFWTDEYVIGMPFPMKEMSEVIPDTILSDEDRIQKKQITEEDNPYLIKYYFK
jgi:hypothetical protein